jgi:hypothetical protein
LKKRAGGRVYPLEVVAEEHYRLLVRYRSNQLEERQRTASQRFLISRGIRGGREAIGEGRVQ